MAGTATHARPIHRSALPLPEVYTGGGHVALDGLADFTSNWILWARNRPPARPQPVPTISVSRAWQSTACDDAQTRIVRE